MQGCREGVQEGLGGGGGGGFRNPCSGKFRLLGLQQPGYYVV